MSAKSEINALAGYIMSAVPDEPSESEGAGTTAIRIIRTLLNAQDQVRVVLAKIDQYPELPSMSNVERPSGEIFDKYIQEAEALDAFLSSVRDEMHTAHESAPTL